MKMDNAAWRAAAIRTVEEVGNYIRKQLRDPSSREVDKRQTGRSPVYVIDNQAESVALDFLQRHELPVVLKSEDSPIRTVTSQPQMVFLLDPLDGSVNAIREIPYYCVSLAIGRLSLLGEFIVEDIEIGIVQDLSSGDTLIAERNRGC